MNDIEKAIEDLSRMLRYPHFKEIHGKYYETAISAMQDLQQYRQIGTLEECREAKDTEGVWC